MYKRQLSCALIINQLGLKPNSGINQSIIFSTVIVDSARAEIMRIDMDASRVLFKSMESEIIYYVMADSGMVYIVTIKKIKPKQVRIEL